MYDNYVLNNAGTGVLFENTTDSVVFNNMITVRHHCKALEMLSLSLSHKHSCPSHTRPLVHQVHLQPATAG